MNWENLKDTFTIMVLILIILSGIGIIYLEAKILLNLS